MSICSSWGDNIDNIVTPRATYTKIHSYWRTNERLSNESTKIQYQPVNTMLHLQVDIESTEIQYLPVNAMLLMKGGGY